jgi:hypothetical protein
MAEDKKPEEKPSTVVQLVAVERGFVLGHLVERGHKFLFDTVGAGGKPRKLPKWAQLADKPLPKKAEVKNGDLKPAAAQNAVKAKAGQLANGQGQGGTGGGADLV